MYTEEGIANLVEWFKTQEAKDLIAKVILSRDLEESIRESMRVKGPIIVFDI